MSKIDPKHFDWSETYADGIARGVITKHLPKAVSEMSSGNINLALEMGAGNCNAASYVHEHHHCKVIAVDPYYQPQKGSIPPWLEFYRTDALSFDYESLCGQVDIVYSIAVVDYMPDSEFRHFCHGAMSTLKSGGVFMFDFIDASLLEQEKDSAPYFLHYHDLTWIKKMPGAKKVRRWSSDSGYNLVVIQK